MATKKHFTAPQPAPQPGDIDALGEFDFLRHHLIPALESGLTLARYRFAQLATEREAALLANAAGAIAATVRPDDEGGAK